jgi:hypothetical protein
MLVGVRLLGDSLERRGWNNVGGYVDCWPSCTRWHLLGETLHWRPPMVGIALLLLVGLLELRARVGDRRAPATAS